MRSLLDVNVLIGLLDANHEHHAAATAWFSKNNSGWASCPTTQNGYLRVVTRGGYGNAISPQAAVNKLSQAVSDPAHQFLVDDISLLNRQLVTPKHIQGHQQWTDVYLLALSVHHGMRFVTFDKSVLQVAVPQATHHHLHVIGP